MVCRVCDGVVDVPRSSAWCCIAAVRGDWRDDERGTAGTAGTAVQKGPVRLPQDRAGTPGGCEAEFGCGVPRYFIFLFPLSRARLLTRSRFFRASRVYTSLFLSFSLSVFVLHS